jgi:hypothetical protein
MAVDDSGATRGVMPAYYSASRLTPRHVATLEGGTIADDAEAAEALYRAAAGEMVSRGGAYLLIRGGLAPSQPPAGTVEVVHTVIETGRPLDEIWRRVQKKTRWAFRQCQDLAFTVGDRDRAALTDFHAVFANHQRRLGTPAPGVAFFEALLKHLGADLKLFMVHRGSRLVGGMLCAAEASGWSSLYVGLEEEARDTHAGYFLYGKVIEWMSLNGVPRFDLGRSTPHLGVHQFKRKWGGEDVMSRHVYFGPRAADVAQASTELRHGNRLRQRVWRWLPDAVSRPFGAVLRRRLPLG